MLVQQNYSCGICKKHESEFKYKLRVDHCHTTGKVRELLCNSCNVLLGHSKENINNLNNAIGYLIKHNKNPNYENRLLNIYREHEKMCKI